MTEWYGWAGTILNVDLTSMKVYIEELSPEFARNYIGGCGFGARILYDEVDPEVDPLSPENVVIIGNGVLSGTITPGTSRYNVISKSPLTGIYVRSSGGGFFGPELKLAGYDLIVIRGKAEKPVYLWINDDHVEIRDASHLWGKDTWTTQQTIRAELNNPDIQTLKIGPAGENMSNYAALIGNLGRAASNFCIAAVWGSKNLKAVAVNGNREVRLAKPEEFISLCNELTARARSDPRYESRSTWGTIGFVQNPEIWKGAPNPLHHTAFTEHYEKNISCFGCHLHCAQFHHVKSGRHQGVTGESIEGGPRGRLMRLEIKDPGFAVKYNNLCDQLGVNVSHLAEALWWAMKRYERRVLTPEDTDGLDLTWGDEEVILKVLHQVAYREGFGETLSPWPRGVAERLGKGLEEESPHVKGGYHYRIEEMENIGAAFGLSVSTRGGDHQMGEAPRQAINALCDMTGTCKWAIASEEGGIHMDDFARLLSLATGVEFTVADLVNATERELLLARAFNAREGIRRVDDYPYPFHFQLKYGRKHPYYDYSGFGFSLEEYDRMLDEYYRQHGCDPETGIPSRERLESLGLRDVADDLDRRGILPL
ncbi:MAG: aldehyde ferredoxin oxidoreductase N-terminal domain-containing protein [Dehalococcoidales bacterium]|nr:aldehyde ferredoxin oxidoreductase N-terminal domain-containing protein [Dehalococcoidales bacterium]